MNLIDIINIRELKPADLNFILDSSIKCLSKYNKTMFRGWNHKDIAAYLEAVFLHILSEDTYTVFLAVTKEDENNILSYIIADTKSNHVLWQFTKYAYRKLGIQKNFLIPLVTDPSLPITVNFQTNEALKMQRNGIVSIVNKHVQDLIINNYMGR